jgi:hypothetical protein
LCRGSDGYEDPSAWQGEEIFKLLKSGDLKFMTYFKNLLVKEGFSCRALDLRNRTLVEAKMWTFWSQVRSIIKIGCGVDTDPHGSALIWLFCRAVDPH